MVKTITPNWLIVRDLKKVPIYLPGGGYIKQLGFETVRKKINPPWQSSIRPLSQEAYDYILGAADMQFSPKATEYDSVDMLKDKLKLAVKDFYVAGNISAIHRIESIASAIGKAMLDKETEKVRTKDTQHTDTVICVKKLSGLFDYCKSMKMSYSYKPILILAFLKFGDKNGCITIQEAATFFRKYYTDRKVHGLPVEKKPCIYLRDDVTDKQIITNLIANPVKALIESGYFFYNEKSQLFSVSPSLWEEIDGSSKSMITKICHQKLRDYYGD